MKNKKLTSFSSKIIFLVLLIVVTLLAFSILFRGCQNTEKEPWHTLPIDMNEKQNK